MFIRSLTVVLFFIWILPLGFFIKPTQEKLACDGQRALCLCTHAQVEKGKGSPMAGFNLKANTDSHKEANASGGGAGHYYLAAHLPIQNNLAMYAINDSMLLAYRNPFLVSIEHVPNA